MTARAPRRWLTSGLTAALLDQIPVDYDLIEKESAVLKKRFNEIFQ